MPINREYQRSCNKVCAYTGKQEADLPDGQRLLLCSKCGETCYIDFESQQKHWKLHKKTCCSLAKDNRRIREGLGFEDFNECTHYIETILSNPASLLSGRNLLYAFQQLRSYALEIHANACLDEAADAVEFEEACFRRVHRKLPALLGKTDDIEAIWASPGFVNYFLSSDVFLSPVMKNMKEESIPPPPKEFFLGHCSIDPETRHDPSLLLPGSYSLFLVQILRTTSPDPKFFEGHSHYENPLFEATVRCVMTAWKDPYSRLSLPSYCPYKVAPEIHSFGSSSFSRSDLFASMLVRSLAKQKLDSTRVGRNNDRAQQNEIVPGLTPSELLQILLMEDSLFFLDLPQKVFFDVLYGILRDQHLNSDKPVWTSFSAGDRLGLIDLCHLSLNPYLSSKTCSLIVCLIVGFESSTILAIHDDLVSSPSPMEHNDQTLEFVKGQREDLLDRYGKPLVAAFTDCLKEKYYKQLEQSGRCDASYPVELCELIAEFAAPKYRLPDSKLPQRKP